MEELPKGCLPLDVVVVAKDEDIGHDQLHSRGSLTVEEFVTGDPALALPTCTCTHVQHPNSIFNLKISETRFTLISGISRLFRHVYV